MHRICSLALMMAVFVFAVAASPAGAADAKMLVGTWSYEKTESSMVSSKPVTIKVFAEWLMTFNGDGTYSEKTRMASKAKTETVSGTYKIQNDIITRSKNKVNMKILVLTDKELVITSVKNSKIFFKRN